MLDDSDLDGLLRAGREERPGELRRSHVRTRVLRVLGTASAASVATVSLAATAKAAGSSSAVGKSMVAWLASSVGTKLAVAALGLGVAGASVSAMWPSSPAAAPPALSAPATHATAARDALPELRARATDADRALPSPAGRASQPGPAVPTRAPPPTKPASTRPVASPGASTDATLPLLRPEAELLSSALRALSAGRPQQALAMLALHARRFPDGALSPERAAARVRALCAQGHAQEAQAESSAFAQKFPGSPLRRMVSGCTP